MMFRMIVADLLIEVHHRYAFIEKQCEDWKCRWTDRKPDIVAETTEEEIREEYASAGGAVSEDCCESICIYRAIARKLTAFSAFVLHGAVVELDGEAYVFTAKSGVGKTTHTRLWLKHYGERARYINGDKPIMRFLDGRLYAFGTPWKGKENYGCNRSAPVRAFCFLEQSKVNQISRADDKEIVERLFHQVLLPEEPEELMAFMDMMDAMVSSLPFYRLKCNISEEAAILSGETMKNAAGGSGK